MKLSEFEERYIFTIKIELDDEGNFIILREPTTLEIKDINKKNEEDQIDGLIKIFPKCLIDHSFEDDNGEKADFKKVASIVMQSGFTFYDSIRIWNESIALKKTNVKK